MLSVWLGLGFWASSSVNWSGSMAQSQWSNWVTLGLSVSLGHSAFSLCLVSQAAWVIGLGFCHNVCHWVWVTGWLPLSHCQLGLPGSVIFVNWPSSVTWSLRPFVRVQLGLRLSVSPSGQLSLSGFVRPSVIGQLAHWVGSLLVIGLSVCPAHCPSGLRLSLTGLSVCLPSASGLAQLGHQWAWVGPGLGQFHTIRRLAGSLALGPPSVQPGHQLGPSGLSGSLASTGLLGQFQLGFVFTTGSLGWVFTGSLLSRLGSMGPIGSIINNCWVWVNTNTTIGSTIGSMSGLGQSVITGHRLGSLPIGSITSSGLSIGLNNWVITQFVRLPVQLGLAGHCQFQSVIRQSIPHQLTITVTVYWVQ